MPAEHPLPTDLQRKVLCELVAMAFIEIRSIAGVGQSKRFADLADVFHNVAREMYGWGSWNPMSFRSDLLGYQRRYATDPEFRPSAYVATFDTAFGEELAAQIRMKEYLESLPPVRSGSWCTPEGNPRMSIRIVCGPAGRHSEEPPTAVGGTQAPTDWFYALFGPMDQTQWDAMDVRFPTLAGAIEWTESTFGPGVTWDANPQRTENDRLQRELAPPATTP